MNTLNIISESVTIDIVPLSRYGENTDLAKVTASIVLESPLAEDTKFLIPKDNIKGLPKMYLPNGEKLVMGDFDPVNEKYVADMAPQIQDAYNSFMAEPTVEKLTSLSKLEADYCEYKQNSVQAITIPAGQRFITFSYSKTIELDAATGLYTLETIVPLTAFTFRTSGQDKASLMVLMPLEIQDQNKIQEFWWEDPTGQRKNLDKISQAGRINLIGYWQQDPKVVVKYNY